MKLSAKKYILSSVLGAFCVVNGAEAFEGTISAQNFNKMYYVASLGNVGVLRNAMRRGLNIDAVNPNGDTGLCIAIKRRNHTAYNTFRIAGADMNHPCTYRISQEYQEFLNSNQPTMAEPVATHKASNGEYLYYNGEDEGSWWPWIIGGALVGGGIYWYTDHHHKKHSSSSSGGGGGGGSVIPGTVGYGLAAYIEKYATLVNSGSATNKLTINATNPEAADVVNKIKFLPNILNNYKYLQTYVKATDGASFTNLSGGDLFLGNASVGASSYGQNSKVINQGKIDIQARNGTIGMVTSNGASAVNGTEDGSGAADDNAIRMIFNGSEEGDTIIGMYADTHSTITNYGKITGTASLMEESNPKTSAVIEPLSVQDLEDLIGVGGGTGTGNSGSGGTGDGSNETIISNNSGTILGMTLFDFYTGTDLSSNTVTAKNYGNITLQAGNNNAATAATSLIGMGSYLDDRFLNGMNNPAFAEQMVLYNGGIIDLAYQKTYNISSEALKLGDGGVIGIRADASAKANNEGTIKIDTQATTIATNNDIAAGMLSLHGAELVNGTKNSVYNGTTSNTGGTIQMLNEATSGGVFYGMLAAKGSGAQTGLYKWQTPTLYNYGLIDMQVSNSFAMASFAGGEIVNDGVINLGVENGQSYYTNNKGLYAAGEDITEEVSLVNNGIINVYAEESAAIYNAFSGSVTETNNGSVYLSNKATDSKVFGGNYSTAINGGSILYKVGNSAKFVSPSGRQDDIGLNVKTEPITSVIEASGDKSTTKQYVVNDETGVITVGVARDSEVDYGGTFGTAAIQVSKQGSARSKGLISLNMFDIDIMQFNTAMWIDSTATAEAFAENYGTIVVSSANSIAMRNDSDKGASASNFGTIYARGLYNYGMATTKVGANIFNGHFLETEGETKTIKVIGDGSIGMYVLNGNAWNYGTIELLGNNTTAFQLDGKDAQVLVEGNIVFGSGLSDVTWFWVTNKATKTFDYDPIVIDGFTLAKVATDKSGGTAYFSKSSTAYVRGENSHLFVADGKNSIIYNRGIVEVSGGAKAMVAQNGAAAYNEMRSAQMRIKDSDSVGIYAEDEGSLIVTATGSKIYVEAGKGLQAEGFAEVYNNGNIDVTTGTGIHLSDGNASKYTEGRSDGDIYVNSSEAIGVEALNGAQFTNVGKIDVKNGGLGIDTDSKVINSGSGEIIVRADSVGINTTSGHKDTVNEGTIEVKGANAYGVKGGIENRGSMYVSSANAYGVYAGAEEDVVNSGFIEVTHGVGIQGKTTNSGSITIYDGIGVIGDITNTRMIDVEGGIGIYGTGINTGTITTRGKAGVQAIGNFNNSGSITGGGLAIEAMNGGSVINAGMISLDVGTALQVDNGGNASNRNSIMINQNGKGFYVKNGGEGTNSGTINISNTGVAAYVEDGGSFINTGKITYNTEGNIALDVRGGSATNSGTITMLGGTAIQVRDGGNAVNDGIIDISQDGYGFYVESGGQGQNSGRITIGKAGYGAYVENGGTFENTGTIKYNSKNEGYCSNIDVGGNCIDENKNTTGTTALVEPIIIAEDGATFINSGTVDLGDASINFDNGGNYVLGSGSTYQAQSLSGHVIIDDEVVKEGFDDTYTMENAFTGQNDGLSASSQSYMFEADVEDNGDTSDVVLTRKAFDDLVEDQELADFFEMNYQAKNNEKMYQAIKSANTAATFNAQVESESGKKFYANLPRENMAVLRGIQHQEQKRVLEDGVHETTLSANYFRTGKDGYGDLSNYEDDVYSATFGGGTRLNRNWSIGGSLTAAYADSSYKDVHSSRENKILMALMPIVYQNSRFKFLTTPSVGVGYGSYKRKTLDNKYEADTFDIYYGLYNHAEYSVDMKIAELVTEAELNLQGVSADDAKEKGGFKMYGQDMTSLEAGIGLKLRKRIKLSNERELMLALGTKYYHEMLDPYKDIRVGTDAASYKLKGYDENKNRLRTAAEAMYKEGDFRVSAEVAHNAEKENNIEGGVGVWYNF